MTMEDAKVAQWKKGRAKGVIRKVRAPQVGAEDFGDDEIVDGRQEHPGRRMTEEEFLAWIGAKTRAEWVDGEVILLPDVDFEQDQLQGWFLRLIGFFVEEHDLGKITSSRFFVRMAGPRSRRLPDICFMQKSREHLFGYGHFEGPPDLIVEVVSPDAAERDYVEKFKQYEAAGVREYWIVDPLIQRMEMHELAKGAYRAIPLKGVSLHSKVLKGLWVKPEWLWKRPLPKVMAVMKGMGK